QTGNCDKKIDLAIVLDASASIGEESFKEDFAKALIRRLALSSDSVRVSLVASYSTHEVREVAIFITNGFSFIGSDAVKIRADEIKRRGIEVMAVGATNRTGDEELEHLLSKPIKDHFFKLNGVDDSILSRICR
ncbi:unnamed protein product, partial [Pocillopora meandrina]